MENVKEHVSVFHELILTEILNNWLFCSVELLSMLDKRLFLNQYLFHISQ